MEDRRKYWMWMSHACGQGSKSAVNILRYYGYPEYVYEADADEIKSKVPGTDYRVLARLDRKGLSEEEDILSWCDNKGVRVLTPETEEYPKSLLNLKDAPLVLYALGDAPDSDDYFHCAVVGTRNMTDYGKRMAYNIGTGLADCGAVLVSGLALGIDGMAMAGALEGGGRCIAVLGCGIDVVYPKEHEPLLKKVLENGSVITEYAPGVSPVGSHFPVRNRIISGLSQAVCVVEGNMSSGSLITARHALYQGRSLYAVPGAVGEAGAEGTNYLLKQGAKIVTKAEDIIEDYEFIYPHTLRADGAVPHISPDEAAQDYSIGKKGGRKKKSPKTEQRAKEEAPFPKEPEEKKTVRHIDLATLGDDDRKVFDFMADDVPMIAEEIAKCGLSLSQVMVSLTMLELAGAVEAGAGGYYLKRAADYGGDPEYITEEDDGI
ncbi:MAG: DNA-processing protein DprA [Clostridia bacterium]|nr:DNA-processing protein DprA [Clostridia bacterium]